MQTGPRLSAMTRKRCVCSHVTWEGMRELAWFKYPCLSLMRYLADALTVPGLLVRLLLLLVARTGLCLAVSGPLNELVFVVSFVSELQSWSGDLLPACCQASARACSGCTGYSYVAHPSVVD